MLSPHVHLLSPFHHSQPLNEPYYPKFKTATSSCRQYWIVQNKMTDMWHILQHQKKLPQVCCQDCIIWQWPQGYTFIPHTHIHLKTFLKKTIHLKKIYNTEWLITSNVCAMEKSNLCSGKHHCGQTSKCTNFFHSWRLLFEGHECKNEHWQHRKVKCNISVSRCNRHMPLLTPRILFCFNISHYVVG